MFALFTLPKTPPVSRTPLRLSRIPPVPPLPPHDENQGDGDNEPNFGPMERASLPPDRVKTRLLIALCVSVVLNVAFYNQAAVWGREVRTVFLRALHKQYEASSGPAQIILVAPKQSTQPGGKTIYVPLVSPKPVASSASARNR